MITVIEVNLRDLTFSVIARSDRKLLKICKLLDEAVEFADGFEAGVFFQKRKEEEK